MLLGTVWLERSTGMSDAKVLNIYNWGDYIDPKLITKFEKQTGYNNTSANKKTSVLKALISKLTPRRARE